MRELAKVVRGPLRDGCRRIGSASRCCPLQGEQCRQLPRVELLVRPAVGIAGGLGEDAIDWADVELDEAVPLPGRHDQELFLEDGERRGQGLLEGLPAGGLRRGRGEFASDCLDGSFVHVSPPRESVRRGRTWGLLEQSPVSPREPRFHPDQVHVPRQATEDSGR